MKIIRILTLSVVAGAIASSASAGDVCTYRVTSSVGFACPVAQGNQLCFSKTALTGPCDQTLRCFSGGSFCTVVMEPTGGPQAQCPATAKRPRGFNCAHLPDFSRLGTPTATRTATVAPLDTPTSTPSATLIPSPTATDTPTLGLPTFTATGTPTGTASATLTATATQTGLPTGTAAAAVGTFRDH